MQLDEFVWKCEQYFLTVSKAKINLQNEQPSNLKQQIYIFGFNFHMLAHYNYCMKKKKWIKKTFIIKTN